MSSKGVKTIYFIIYVLPGDRGGWNLDRFLYLSVRCLWGIREPSAELKSRRGSSCSSSHTYIHLAVFPGRRWKMPCLLASTLSLSILVAKRPLADQSAWFQEPTCFSTSTEVPGWEMHWFVKTCDAVSWILLVTRKMSCRGHVYPLYIYLCYPCLVAKSCPTLCDHMDRSMSGSSSHGIFQARILEWVALSFSRAPPPLRDRTWVFCFASGFLTIWATREAPYTYIHTCMFVHMYMFIYIHTYVINFPTS